MDRFSGLKASSQEWQQLPESEKHKNNVIMLVDENNNNKLWLVKNKYGKKHNIQFNNGIWVEIP